MISSDPVIFIVSSDRAVAQDCSAELAAAASHLQVVVADTVDEARKSFKRHAPTVVFLDESGLGVSRSGDALETAVALLTESAPVVVAAAAEKQSNLGFLITSGAVDFFARKKNFVPIAAGLIDRRVRLAERAEGLIHFPAGALTGDFGEILRHEVNNPLTGILGNAELLLTRRNQLPPVVVERLQTIADLAVRLRETVRKLSDAWESHHERARPA